MAAEKRDRMRTRLIESAILVFADKGVEVAVIDDMIAMADVSRGTFYNYFRTNEELMSAALQVLSNELLALVDVVVLQCGDPAERLVCGIRTVLHATTQNKLLARFMSRVGLGPILQNSLAIKYLPRDIQSGIEAGQFCSASTELAMVLVLGTIHAAIHSQAVQPSLSDNFPEMVTYHVLLGLGVAKERAYALVSTPIARIIFPDALINFACNVFLSDVPELLVGHHAVEDFLVTFHSINEHIIQHP